MHEKTVAQKNSSKRGTEITGDNLYDCYRKADVVLGKCDAGTEFTTFVRQEWAAATGYNCYPGHGATDIEKPSSSDCGVMNVVDCRRKCESTAGCTAITWEGKDHSGVGRCFRKAAVDLSKCDKGTDFDTYVRYTNTAGENSRALAPSP